MGYVPLMKVPPNRKLIFTTGEIAGVCGVAPRTVAKWTDTGLLPGYRIPGSNDRRVTRASLVAFLRRHGMPTGGLSESHRVLVLTPDPALAAALAALLPDASGFEHSHALTPFAAGGLAAVLPPDVAVLDHHAGRSACAEVLGRLNPPGRGARVVALANEDEEPDPAGLGGDGYSAYLRHPFAAEDLAALVRALAGEKFPAKAVAS